MGTKEGIAMQCQHCGKSDWVTIGNQKYCANCGELSTSSPSAGADAAAASPAVAAPAATTPTIIMPTDSTPKPVADPTPSEVKVTAPTPDTGPTNAATEPPHNPQPTTHDSQPPVLNDLSHPQATASPTAPGSVKPANSFHNGPVPAPAGVLDLRKMAVTAPAPTPAVQTPAVTQPTTQPATEPTGQPSPPAINTVTPPAPAEPMPQANPVQTQPQPVRPSEPLNPPTHQVEGIMAPKPATAAAGTQPASIQKFVRPDTIAPAHLPTPPAPPTPTVLPPAAANHIESMRALVPPSAVPATNPQLANPTTASNGPKVQNIMAATLAVMIMGGYIWLNNFNTLNVKSAAKKAGIEASLPGYMPNSYNLSGPIDYGQGFVTLNFKSPNSATPLRITQRRTNWDSSALLQLYVHPQSNSYVSVANQGLTIYLYDNNQATWVNKGLQYVIAGDTRLSRDQILKIATSL